MSWLKQFLWIRVLHYFCHFLTKTFFVRHVFDRYNDVTAVALKWFLFIQQQLALGLSRFCDLKADLVLIENEFSKLQKDCASKIFFVKKATKFEFGLSSIQRFTTTSSAAEIFVVLNLKQPAFRTRDRLRVFSSGSVFCVRMKPTSKFYLLFSPKYLNCYLMLVSGFSCWLICLEKCIV